MKKSIDFPLGFTNDFKTPTHFHTVRWKNHSFLCPVIALWINKKLMTSGCKQVVQPGAECSVCQSVCKPCSVLFFSHHRSWYLLTYLLTSSVQSRVGCIMNQSYPVVSISCGSYCLLQCQSGPRFYPLDALHSAVFAVVRCLSLHLSIWLSVCHTPVLCVNLS